MINVGNVRCGVEVGVGWNFGGYIDTVERFLASAGLDMELATFVGLKVVGFPFHP